MGERRNGCRHRTGRACGARSAPNGSSPTLVNTAARRPSRRRGDGDVGGRTTDRLGERLRVDRSRPRPHSAYRSTQMRPTVRSSSAVPEGAVIESQRTPISCSSCSSSAPPAIRRVISVREISSLAKSPRLAAVQEQETVAHGEGVVGVVRDEDHAEAAVRGARDVLQHDTRLLARRVRTSARRGSAPARRSTRRGRSRPTGARHPTACRPVGRRRGHRCPSWPSPPWPSSS